MSDQDRENSSGPPETGQDSSLTDRTVKGGLWMFGLKGANRLIGVARTVVLARLLAPSDFGLFGIAMLTMMTVEKFTKTGFDKALVQKKENIREFLDTAWTVQLIRCLALSAALFFLASPIASFFNEPGAERLIQVISASLVVSGFRNIGVVYLRKELEFSKQFLYEFSAMATDLVVSIGVALYDQSAWALIFGLLAGNSARLIVSYAIHSYRPSFSLSWEKSRELFSYGRWVFGSTVLIFLVTSGDDLFVSKMLGATALGFYQMAFKISNMPATEISHTVVEVTFPAFSKVQDNVEKLKEGFLKTVRVVSFVTFPIAAGLFAVSEPFTIYVLGNDWKPIIPLIMILVFQGLIRSIRGVFGSYLSAVGRPDVETKIVGVQLLILGLLIYPASIHYGLLGVAFVVVLQTALTLPILLYVVLPKIDVRPGEFFSSLLSPMLTSVVMGTAVYVLPWVLKLNFLTVLLQIVLGVALYAAFFYIIVLLDVSKPLREDLQQVKRSLLG